jgi:4-hydroxybenzoate polyprenyltransferase
MNILRAFLKLIRWPNLLFIALTQILFRYFILPFSYLYQQPHPVYKLNNTLFLLLMIASVCIAAAGYIINGYFDLNIDLVNKPGSLIVDRYIKRRWTIVWHITLSAVGLLLSLYIGVKLHNFYIPVFNLLSIVALWFYSASFKKKFFIGNVVIALLTAWVILIIMVAEYRFGAVVNESWQRLLKFTFIYSGFAFIISLVREVVKDMEDLPGDEKYGCKTMPIVWGIRVSKVYAAVWISVLIATAFILLFYVIQLGWWISALYSLLAVVLPLGWLMKKLYEARTTADYHQLSSAIKIIMLCGMLSMIFFSKTL